MRPERGLNGPRRWGSSHASSLSRREPARNLRRTRADTDADSTLRSRAMNDEYPVAFSVEYPDRALNRLTTALRLFTIIPIAVVFASIGGYTGAWGGDGGSRSSTL